MYQADEREVENGVYWKKTTVGARWLEDRRPESGCPRQNTTFHASQSVAQRALPFSEQPLYNFLHSQHSIRSWKYTPFRANLCGRRAS